MFSREQRFGAAPVKIVFNGVPPGSPAARLLYSQRQGEINAFITKARAQAMATGQPGSHMQQVLSTGDRVRYSFNHGLETVHVQVTAGSVEQVSRALRPSGSVPTKIFLAIDILWDLEEYQYYDLYTYNLAPFASRFIVDDYYTRETIWAARAAYDVGIVYNPGGANAASLVFQGVGLLPKITSYPVIAAIQETADTPYSSLPQSSATASCALIEGDASGAPVVLDVYAASYNSRLKNSAGQRSREIPDTDFYSSFDPESAFRIQVRELSSEEIRRVTVNKYFGQRQQLTRFNFRDFDFNLVSQSPTIETIDKDFRRNFRNLRAGFQFFVDEDFVVAPSSSSITPGGDGMGNLLDSTDVVERDLVGPHNQGAFPWSAGWDVPGNGGKSARSPASMTKIAKIFWQPPKLGEAQGVATIDLDV